MIVGSNRSCVLPIDVPCTHGLERIPSLGRATLAGARRALKTLDFVLERRWSRTELRAAPHRMKKPTPGLDGFKPFDRLVPRVEASERETLLAFEVFELADAE